MRRVPRLIVLVLLLCPPVAEAIQLHWSTGAANLTFTEATRCTLVVEADSAAAALPAEARLLWVADSSSVQFVALDSVVVCQTDTAQVSRIDGPTTAADSSANLITAYFCSAGANGPPAANYVVDLADGAHGKLKVVALDPADSSRVIESNEVTINGGLEGDYPPVILRASSVHQSLDLWVTAVGANLAGARSLSIAATDGSWSLPLTITKEDDTAVTATAAVAAIMPACVVQASAENGGGASALLPVDIPSGLLEPEATPSYMVERLDSLPVHLQPKDFAMVWAINGLHVFYTRYDKALTQAHGLNLGTYYSTKNLGHAQTTDLITWNWTLPRDTTVLQVDTLSTRWDNWHVWAPSIIQKGITYYMFYTGVHRNGIGDPENQSIGYATSTDLVDWNLQSTNVLTTYNVPWAVRNSHGYGPHQQLRDPFVMEHPPESGHYLMYFVAVMDSATSHMAVGVARSNDLLEWTADSTCLLNTRDLIVESPHIFPDSSRWWLFFTNSSDRVRFQTNLLSRSPADSVQDHWTPPDWSVWLYYYLNGSPPDVAYWHASEHLVACQHEYLAAFSDSMMRIDFSEMVWYLASPSPPRYEFVLGSASTAGVMERAGLRGSRVVALRVTRLRPGTPEVGLRVELPSAAHVQLSVYDVLGRHRRTLLNASLPAGSTAVLWDGRDGSGAAVSTGMYFARLAAGGVQRVVKLPLVR